MVVDLGRFRLERFQAEVTYHATWTFQGLKGVLGETWAHGPIFGAFSDAGPQVTLTPATDSPDLRISAVAGVRASGLLAEGPEWASRGAEVAQRWLADVFDVLKPQRTVGMRVSLFGLHPIRDPDTASGKLRGAYFNEEALASAVGDLSDNVYTSLDVLIPGEGDTPSFSYVVGVVGPPHRGMFFNYEDSERDAAWWMGVRFDQFLTVEDGIEDPMQELDRMISSAEAGFRRVAGATLPRLID